MTSTAISTIDDAITAIDHTREQLTLLLANLPITAANEPLTLHLLGARIEAASLLTSLRAARRSALHMERGDHA